MRKKNPYFQFKQFSVEHAGAAMKVGTDGVLIGCWADVEEAKMVLDIGTGSGVIALILAQRTEKDTVIHAVETESDAAKQALRNVEASPWPDKIKVHPVRIQEFRPNLKFDHIVTNPPFFVNSFLPPDKRRKEARHTASLSFADLVASAIALLDPLGKFSLIIPPVEGAILREYAMQHGLYCSRLCEFRPRAEKRIERWLMEFTFQEKETTKDELVMYGTGDEWTPRFKALSKDFYLNI
jgi:tRNA1Val (adenine37-N6)-methyltransferase